MSDVTAAVRELVDTLHFRDSLGQSYLAPAPRLRWALIVPTMMTGSPLERSRAINNRTVQAAKRLGLITVSDDAVALQYGYRKPGESPNLYAVTLTDAARTELARGKRDAFKDYALGKDDTP